MNTIAMLSLSKPLKTRQAMDINNAWTELHNKL